MRELVSGNSDVLHSTAWDVQPLEDITELLTDMWAILKRTGGIGLAAPQVGVSKRVIIINYKGFMQEFINPEIIDTCGKRSKSIEGCLSYPVLQVTKWRYKQVKIVGRNKSGELVTRKLKGVAACCAQHEIDHLNGITIADKKEG